MTAQKLRWRVRRYFCYRRLFRTKANPPESNFVIRARTGGAVISCCSDIFLLFRVEWTRDQQQESRVLCGQKGLDLKKDRGRTRVEFYQVRLSVQFSSTALILCQGFPACSMSRRFRSWCGWLWCD